MSMDLAGYRAALGALLGTAVDVSTWTTALLDEGLRGGLMELDPFIVYETDVTVTVKGQTQDLSGISGLHAVIAVAWPWSDAIPWRNYKARWRRVTPTHIFFEREIPDVGDVLRVRYTLFHRIEDLDGATATSVPDRWERPLVYLSGARALQVRMRQLTENPAVPKEAIERLGKIADGWTATAGQLWATGSERPVWDKYGLE